MSIATQHSVVRSRSKRQLSVDQVDRDASSYVDPHGFVFHWSGNIYRCIHEEHAPFYRSLIDQGLFQHWQNNFHLVSTGIADLELIEHPGALVLSHERVSPLTYCVEWCPSMLRKAGLATLNLANDLVGRGLMLQDAYPWNVLFRGTEAVFVDVTSIAPADERVIWPAHEQFESFFYRPLVLAVRGMGQVARSLLYDNISGVGMERFYGLLSSGYRLRHPGLAFTHWLHRRLSTSRKLKAKVRSLAAKAAPRIDNRVRKRFLQRLTRRLENLRVVTSKDPWENYYAEISAHVDKQAKLKQVGQFLDQLQPATVLDLGCNTGVFSIEAARRGATVVSVDSSETCIETLFHAAEGEHLRITPVVSGVCCPTGSFGFMGTQYGCIWDRAQSDIVLCLGLMHHLHLTGRQSFERIAKLMSAVTRKTLIFEFVARDDENIELLPERRTVDYDLESVTDALRVHFPNIKVHDSDRPTRRLLLCTK